MKWLLLGVKVATPYLGLSSAQHCNFQITLISSDINSTTSPFYQAKMSGSLFERRATRRPPMLNTTRALPQVTKSSPDLVNMMKGPRMVEEEGSMVCFMITQSTVHALTPSRKISKRTLLFLCHLLLVPRHRLSAFHPSVPSLHRSSLPRSFQQTTIVQLP